MMPLSRAIEFWVLSEQRCAGGGAIISPGFVAPLHDGGVGTRHVRPIEGAAAPRFCGRSWEPRSSMNGSCRRYGWRRWPARDLFAFGSTIAITTRNAREQSAVFSHRFCRSIGRRLSAGRVDPPPGTAHGALRRVVVDVLRGPSPASGDLVRHEPPVAAYDSRAWRADGVRVYLHPRSGCPWPHWEVLLAGGAAAAVGMPVDKPHSRASCYIYLARRPGSPVWQARKYCAERHAELGALGLEFRYAPGAVA